MNRLLIVGILIISTAPLYAQRQQQDVAKLKANARNTVGIIGGDRQRPEDLPKARMLAKSHVLSCRLIDVAGRIY